MPACVNIDGSDDASLAAPKGVSSDFTTVQKGPKIETIT